MLIAWFRENARFLRRISSLTPDGSSCFFPSRVSVSYHQRQHPTSTIRHLAPGSTTLDEAPDPKGEVKEKE